MLILVTRPIPEAWDLKAKIERLGYEAMVAPLLEIVPQEIAPDAFDGASGLIVTSQNALRSLALAGMVEKVHRLQVYAVGETTAKLATDLKLPNITAGRGTAEDLIPAIAERHKTRRGHLIHLAGDHLAYDLKGALAAKGIEVREVTAYRSVAAGELPREALGALKSGRLGAVTLMSPRTAETWVKLATKYGLQGEMNKLIHLCLSDAVAAQLQLGPGARVEIAAEPKPEEMLSLIKGLAAAPDGE